MSCMLLFATNCLGHGSSHYYETHPHIPSSTRRIYCITCEWPTTYLNHWVQGYDINGTKYLLCDSEIYANVDKIYIYNKVVTIDKSYITADNEIYAITAADNKVAKTDDVPIITTNVHHVVPQLLLDSVVIGNKCK